MENEGTFTTLQQKCVNFLEISTKDENKEDLESTQNDSNISSDIIQNAKTEEHVDEEEPQETEEFLAKGRIKKSLYWNYLHSGGSVIMIIVFLCCIILGQIGSSGCDYWVGYW